MKNHSASNGPGDPRRDNNTLNSGRRFNPRLIIGALAHASDGVPKAIAYVRSLFRGNKAPERAELNAKVAAAQAEVADLDADIPKMQSALSGGPPFLPADYAQGFPASWPARLGLIALFCLLVGLEISAALNVMSLVLPLVQSKLTALCMVAPILAVPAAVKLLAPPFKPFSVALALTALLGAAAYALALAAFLGLPPEDGPNLGGLLKYQLLAETFGLAAVTGGILRLLAAPPSEALLGLLNTSRNRKNALLGEVERFLALLAGLDENENAAAIEFEAMTNVIRANNEAEEQFIARRHRSAQDLFNGLFSNDRN